MAQTNFTARLLVSLWVLMVADAFGVLGTIAEAPHSSRFLCKSTATDNLSATGNDAMANGADNMELKKGISEIVDQFDTFLLDMWGVMHDGSSPYAGVLEVVSELKQANKKLVILSNSSKRRDNSVKMLQKLGFDPNDFDQIITSGEVAYQMMDGSLPLWHVLEELQKENRRKVFVFGSGDDDKEYCESCGWTLTTMEEANLIVARGTFTVTDGVTTISKREDPEMYEKELERQLKQAASSQIPMLVTNPDKIRPDVERPPMPGKIADRYEEILGETLAREECQALVKRIGKPFPDVYNLAIEDKENRNRVCMVGDALETDVVGGVVNGVSTIWVLLDGIHGPSLDADEGLMSSAELVVDRFNRKSGTYAGDQSVSPNIVLRHFRWEV